MHAYALLNTPPPASDLRLPEGIAGPLTLVHEGALAAIVELDLDITVLQADEAALLQAILGHDRVIHQLFQQTTILPLRFAVFPTLATLVAHLATHQPHYLAQLARLAGQAEYTIKLQPLAAPEPAIAPELRGKAYFLAKKQQHLAQERYQHQQQTELDGIRQTLARRYPLQWSEESHQAYLLSDQAQSDQLYAAIAHLQTQFPTWAIQLGEPLAPFHFVEAISSSGAASQQ